MDDLFVVNLSICSRLIVARCEAVDLLHVVEVQLWPCLRLDWLTVSPGTNFGSFLFVRAA